MEHKESEKEEREREWKGGRERDEWNREIERDKQKGIKKSDT